MRYAKLVFLLAGVYGLVVVACGYFLEFPIGRATPPPLAHPEYFYAFLGVGLAWQLVFFVISRDPARYHALILVSIVEKALFGFALIVLFGEHRVPPSLMAIGAADWVFALLFAAVYFALRPRHALA